MAVKTVFITTTGTSTFTVPPDFGSLVSVEGIGGGGSSASKDFGGGGGAYAKSTTVSGLSPNQTCYVSVGTGGISTGGTATDTWFNVVSNAAPTLASQGILAKAANASTGGQASASVGDLKYSGGNGGTTLRYSGAGGAAGPGGAGGNGGDGDAVNGGSGGGGGGAGLTSPGSNGQTVTFASNGTLGGTGGNGGGGSGGGTAGNASSGGAGVAGTGGGGGGAANGSGYNGGNGASGSIWTQTYNGATAGPGGGAGGGTTSGGGTAKANGGLYGGGGGSNVTQPSAVGDGAQGIIVFTYNDKGTGFKTTDPNTNTPQDLDQRYLTKNYILDVYPNIASATGSRKSPGLWAWGHGVYGNLGNNSGGSTTYYSSPVQVGTLANWKQVSTSKYFTLAVKTDGTMWSWGRNDVGQLGINAVGTRYYSSPVQIGALTSWKYVWAGYNDFAFAISNTGALWCWGGSGGNAGNDFALPIQTQNVYYSSPVQVGALTNWKSVVDFFAIKTDGSLWAWGNNGLGVLGNGNRTSYSSPIQIGALTNWKQISMNSNTTAAAVKTDGTLWTWGANLRGSLGIGVSTFNLYYSSPIQVGSLSNWKQVACGVQGITLAVKTDGTLWGWGWAASTIFGGNINTYYSSPVQIGALTNWKSISMYNQSDTAYAIKTDGSLWFLGYSAFGESGTGTAVVNPAPVGGVQIGTSTTWKQVSGGLYSAAAIQDGYI